MSDEIEEAEVVEDPPTTGEWVNGRTGKPEKANMLTPVEPAAEIERYEPPRHLMNDLWDLASRICRTQMVPEAYRHQPEAALAAMVYGHEVGFGAMQSLNSINVVKGKPTLSAEAMRALVIGAGHKVECETSKDGATVKLTRKDGAVYSASFGPDDAKRANLVGGNYAKYPQAMYLARATSACLRMGAPDVLKGVSYTPEELGAIDVEEVELTEDEKKELARRDMTSALADRIKAQEQPIKDRLKAYIVDAEFPTLPREWTVEQVKCIGDYLTDLLAEDADEEVVEAEIVEAEEVTPEERLADV